MRSQAHTERKRKWEGGESRDIEKTDCIDDSQNFFM